VTGPRHEPPGPGPDDAGAPYEARGPERLRAYALPMNRAPLPVALGLLLGLGALALFVGPVAGCGGSRGSNNPSGCASYQASAVLDVSGTWDYEGDPITHRLFGTITMTQVGTTVTVTGCTYTNAPQDRSLTGAADLDGNRLEIVLSAPANATRPPFEADCVFLFDATGTRFCVEFSDTNGDVGGMGSYEGTLP
jgi:hypothetical protein